jgi:molecular chaperone DnaK
MGKAIGIDLGTTNSVACFFDGREAKVLLNTYQEELTPSVVADHTLDDDDGADKSIAVGRAAVAQARLFPRDTIYSVKRLMGRRFNAEKVQEWKSRVTYQVVETQAPVKGLAAVEMGRQVYLPEDISKLILENIKSYAEKVLGEEVTHAVVTVPAYFGDLERAATREAGRKAGLVVKTLLPEPTAAAIAFGAAARVDERFVLVYDLGGGTFDISVLSIVQTEDGSPSYNVIRVGGEHFLGGDDFDRVIVDMILAHVQDKHKVDLAGNTQFLTVARQEAEKAKKVLSAEDTAQILLVEAAQVDGKAINIKMRISRAEFEKRIAPLVDKAQALVLETLKAESMTPSVIDDVLLVGGSTAVPMVGASMEALFGKDKVRRSVNPMHCVAIGAGMLAAQMKGVTCPNDSCKALCDEGQQACPTCGHSLSVAKAKLEGIEISDITTNHIGIQGVKGNDPNAFFALIERGTPIPMKEPRFQTVFTTEEQQKHIRVPVFEGVGTNILQNTLIGQVDYDLPFSLPINHQVRVGLMADRSAIVRAVIEIENFGIRHEQELRRDVEEVQEVAEPPEDKLIDEDEVDVNEDERSLVILERYVAKAEKFKEQYDRIIAAGDKKKLDRAIEDGRRILDEEKGKEAMEAIMKIDRVLSSCGTPSLIEQARQVASGTDQETAEKLHALADQMTHAAEDGHEGVLKRLRDPVASLIRQVYTRAQSIEQVGAAKGFGGLLGDKRSTGT